MPDQLGPWMIDPDNPKGRYLVFDNLYEEMRLMGGVALLEPTHRLCKTHRCVELEFSPGLCAEQGYLDAYGKRNRCVIIDLFEVTP